MNPDNFNMSEQELNAQRRRRAENFKLNIDESEYEDDNFVKSEDEPSNLNSYSGQDVKKQMARESKQVLKQKKKEEKKALKAKNKYNRRTFRFIWIISVLIVGAMAAVYMITGMNDLLAVNRTDSSTVKIEIPENPTVDDVIKVLVDNKVIGEPSYFKLFVNVTKSADDFTQGTYEIRRNMDYEAIINFLSSNNNRTDTVSVTITEGESVLEIANTLEKNGALGDRDEFLSLCNSEKFDSDFDFIKAETNADKRYYKLEGYLYPDTYEFYRNENAESVIYKFLNNYETKINEKQTVDGYSKKTTVLKMVEESDTKYSLDQVMTIASIIQAEAADKEDMYYISSILHN
ncbi:MAG: endolytic transglycosylase MltG, partial [Ruminococcus bromii]